MRRVTVLCGGVGAARFLAGLVQATDPAGITAIVNVADDTELHGLMISPDLDTVTYTLAGAIDPTRGWGLVDETWQAMEQLRHYGRHHDIDPSADVGNDAAGWFALGDRDLGTHLYRTSRRLAGATLSDVTTEIAGAWAVDVRLLPVTDDPIRTMLTTVDGRRLGFQEYFVREHHDVEIAGVAIEGSESARPAPGVLESIDEADVIVIAPSNPVVSIAPVLAVPGLRETVRRARERTVAISPIVGGRALKGPADRLLRELGHESSVTGVADWYRDLASTLVIDTIDAHDVPAIEQSGLRTIVVPTVMSEPGVARALAQRCIEAAVAP